MLLLIEVSGTSLSYDRNVELPLYACFGIRDTWLVDLVGESIERHAEPASDGYRLVRRTACGESLWSEALPALALPVGIVLG